MLSLLLALACDVSDLDTADTGASAGQEVWVVLDRVTGEAALRLNRDASVLDDLDRASGTQLLAALAESTVATIEL